MPSPDDANPVLHFLRPLNASGLRYMVTGSVAAIIYGKPRLTHDVDLVLVLPSEKSAQVLDLFPEGEFYCPPLEILYTEASRPAGGHFNLIHHATGFKADVYCAGNDLLHAWALSARQEAKIGDETVFLAPPEYVIIRKIQYYRMGGSSKHLQDISAILKVSGGKIDVQLLEESISMLSLDETWEGFTGGDAGAEGK